MSISAIAAVAGQTAAWGSVAGRARRAGRVARAGGGGRRHRLGRARVRGGRDDRRGGGGRVAGVTLVELGRNVNIASAAIADVALLVGVEWLDELGPGACNRGRFADDALP